MCNYSAYVWDKGRTAGRAEGRAEGEVNVMRKLMAKMGLSLSEVLAYLDIPSSELATYERLISAA